nr:hypothetical protein [Tanacetum cinerariifolium]
DTIESTRSVLFNSVYIGLDQSRDNLDSAALLAAIDEELDDLGTGDNSSISSWQTDFPAGQPGNPARGAAGSSSGKGKKL